ncbi:hypothetical protein R69608_05146 [Paraburkholderia nemoris]|uniref:hypothetical protein n=1 Tax=Paraburkholderia nemoris TaxID=2793076 RepID=UPI001913414F|nr:hypothetical protein [Paraburkholderia nemoris]MBK5149652.1 hypothetical protein [Burkholderia sp. R-69608]CAE6939289.1 hypothetical protein R69608_05146 [Paraburkholderia nemoris]
MPVFTFADNINTTLAGNFSSSATSFTLASSAHLPASIPSGEYLVITLNDSATRGNFEVIYVGTISGATCSNLLRAQEGTAALSWLTGDYAYCGPTAGQMDSFGQKGAANTWTGANIFNDPVTVGAAVTSGEAVNLGQLVSFGGNSNSSGGGTNITASASFVTTQNCLIIANGTGGNQNPISNIALTASNATAVSSGGNVTNITGGFDNIAIASAMFKASAGADVTITISMSYTTSPNQNVEFNYFVIPIP